MISRVIRMMAVVIPAVVFISQPALALTGAGGKVPNNPQFAEYLLLQTALKSNLFDDSHPKGLIPRPHAYLAQPPTAAATVKSQLEATATAARFDLRGTGKVTSVKNQADCGSCWSFAANAALESTIPKKSPPWNFSEQHLCVTSGFDWGPCDGGNIDMAVAYLTRYSGPIAEEKAPYYLGANGTNTAIPAGTKPLLKRVQGVEYFGRQGFASTSAYMNKVKSAILKGGVYSSLQWDNTFCSDLVTCPAYYNDGRLGGYTNHAVVLVGWDDNYAPTHFKATIRPTTTGAFLAKNSWGTGFGNSGYFYISYSDYFLGGDHAAFTSVQAPTYAEKAYSYDKLGWTDTYYCGSPNDDLGIWGANVFTAGLSVTAGEIEKITAIAFYTPDYNTKIQYSVYKNLPSTVTSAKSGTLAYGPKIATFAYPGYHTINLSPPVAVTKGSKFSVIVRFYNNLLPAETRIPGYSSLAAISGQSMVSCGGVDWENFNSWAPSSNGNVTIKALSKGLPK